jgi:hypothetical protein
VAATAEGPEVHDVAALLDGEAQAPQEGDVGADSDEEEQTAPFSNHASGATNPAHHVPPARAPQENPAPAWHTHDSRRYQ